VSPRRKRGEGGRLKVRIEPPGFPGGGCLGVAARTREFAAPPTLAGSEVCLWPLSFNIGAGMQGLTVRKPRVIALMAGRSIREFMAS